MAGESYAVNLSHDASCGSMFNHIRIEKGRFIPVFASEIFDQNARLRNAGLHPVNISSIMLGVHLCISFPGFDMFR